MPAKRETKPTVAETIALRTLLLTSPRITVSCSKFEKDTLAFLREVKASLDPEEYRSFIDDMQCCSTKSCRGDINFQKGVGRLEKVSPDLCDKFMRFFMAEFKQRRLAQISLAAVPAVQPAKCFLNRDLLSVVVLHVPYKSLGYLISTCRWMRVNITAEQVRQCRKRAKIAPAQPSERRLWRLGSAKPFQR